MTAPPIRQATDADAQALTALINRAFQVEKFFIDSDRITLDQLHAHMRSGLFLIAEDADGMAACVYVELRGERGYFGLLSVEPLRQRGGFGRSLIAAAEAHCRQAGCVHMDMTVVNLREELPPFYHKLGYAEIGTSPFPPEVETKLPCYFVRMSKPL